MGDEVEIGRGGVIAVDPEDLRVAAGRVRYAAIAVQLAEQELQAIPARVQASGIGEVSSLWTLTNRLETVGTALDGLVCATETLADVYELAELRARQAMAATTDPRLVQSCQVRIDELLRANGQLSAAEERVRKEWEEARTAGFTPAAIPAPYSPDGLALTALFAVNPALYALFSTMRFGAAGLTGAGEQLIRWGGSQWGVVAPGPLAPTPGRAVVAGDPRPGDVRVKSAATREAPAAAPASLGEAVSRIPKGGAQVRVETYRMGDGSTRFVAYVDGTRSKSTDGTDRDPWDMASNGRAYLDHAESDAYKATVAALEDAGADASTPVDLVGYSQGGMITDLLAQSGRFDVQAVFTVGSPVEPVLPDDVLSVAVRHTDDPVAGLAGGGSPSGTGSADSLVITRTVAPGHGIDPGMPAHDFDGYRETVRLAEASGDPRMDAIREHFAALAGATMTSRDYASARVLP
ncbi:hypothetical protein [Microbacterium capsulatum]|uniref:Alpha/beta hydrolase n=1 Tax=Microbacterium capsulatum TaxID=3041921 RepID=A0ABU0XIB6_9MICO|nr:hypothetical protein [Microbacterium sp. ASV81]MDQ4214889.1 hypothetical protein [Microbacterium sp. ASV81]